LRAFCAGTIEYMAPEMISGVGHSFTVDFWIVGVMLYEMLYGVTAFRGKDAQSTFINITSQEVSFQHPLIKGKQPRVSKACRQLIQNLLMKDQKKRLGYSAGVGEFSCSARASLWRTTVTHRD
jgi:serine/threonine protein kinase